MDNIAYKILTSAQYAALQEGSFTGAPVDLQDGYIHLSTAAQLDETLSRHFAGQTGLIIAAVDLTALESDIRWEVSRHGALFPHLYGRLEPASVIAACPLEIQEDGTARLPAAR